MEIGFEDLEKANLIVDCIYKGGKYLSKKYHCEMDEHCTENVINMMTNEFPTSAAKKTYA